MLTEVHRLARTRHARALRPAAAQGDTGEEEQRAPGENPA
ncbi:predicted protein [Streptomyces viridosporus ATCC 14672]|uniref:Predicted protein n=1 Tax=Streptomyces viridosporus (strain ATCC 14672 / DSM 40746 / JCM 4963 / KCTC 9882 / NRRL B-12104 / FH 1290) TaxID=566461 RepID=D5ZP05_STRV1|nr:predicted protein [Streptomyces viridosporus ATCC 14672]